MTMAKMCCFNYIDKEKGRFTCLECNDSYQLTYSPSDSRSHGWTKIKVK